MPENPLLPHRKLRELYRSILSCRDLQRRLRRQGRQTVARGDAREALLAATSIQLLPGDLLCAEPDDALAAALLPIGKAGKFPASFTAPVPSRLTACAAAALGVKAAGGVVLAYTRAGATEPGWQEALRWAHRAELPLLLVVGDATAWNARGKLGVASARLSWAAMQPFAKRLRLPVLTVDGEDAVAVYRVMQESVIRARHSGGAAVVWAVMGAGGPTPLARLQSYLRARKIALPKRT